MMSSASICWVTRMVPNSEAMLDMSKVDILSAKADTARHVADVFLRIAYGDSTKEQIIVPMIEVKGEWKMR